MPDRAATSTSPPPIASRMANAVRALASDAVEAAKSRHPGLPMGAADVASALFTRHLKFDAAEPGWPDRDRFVLSAGHGSMLLYALLHLTGYPEMTMAELRRFRQLDSKTPGHPETTHTPAGVETTSGPLGQGLAIAVGMALGERMMAARFGRDIVDHRTYVLASDGDLMEGISQEAIGIAGHLKLARLVVLWDDNGISIDGPLSMSDSTDQLRRFRASGWRAERVDGHDQDAVGAALDRAKRASRPTLIACRTVIGYGAPTRAGTSKAHGEPLGAQEAGGAKAALGWTAAPFEVPDDLGLAWREAGSRASPERAAWQARLDALPARKREEFVRRLRLDPPERLAGAVRALTRRLGAEPQAAATRKASETALEAFAPVMPELITGSADLTPSNNAKPSGFEPVRAGSYRGRYIHWGIREHAMAAAMNGLALHGGFRPAGGTFLVFSDYCRPAIRMAALTGLPVVYVMTHDSIGRGEDGPTHQPVEHLAALRAIPNLRVYRPADAVETAECWELALTRRHGPSLLALTRQTLPQLRLEPASRDNRCAEGAYELAAADGGRAGV